MEILEVRTFGNRSIFAVLYTPYPIANNRSKPHIEVSYVVIHHPDTFQSK